MSHSLEDLKTLHELDSEIIRLRTKQVAIPERAQEFRKRLDGLRKKLQSRQAELKKLRAKIAADEKVLRSKEEDILQLQVKMNTARKDIEYKAFKHQIESQRADNSLLEDKVLLEMSRADEAKEECDTLNKLLAAEEANIRREEAELSLELDGAGEQLEEAIRARDAAAACIEPELLIDYKRILGRRGATAIVPVRDNTCQGCFTRLTPQLVSLTITGREIVHCGSCGRILYRERED